MRQPVLPEVARKLKRLCNSGKREISPCGANSPGEETVNLTLAVTKDAAKDQIDMQGGVIGGEVITYRSFGFGQEGSDLLVLVDLITTSDGSAGLGLIIAM